MARKAPPADAGYDDYKGKQADISRKRSAAGREIGPLPEVANPARKNRGLESLEAFALSYFPSRFPLPFSGAHREMMAAMEKATNDGGLYCVAFMRGGGKTTVAECAVLRAILYGLRSFVVFVGATEDHASAALKRIQAELETNDILYEDFPEATYPVRRLERIHNRARGQMLNGIPTRIQWTSDGVILPTVPGAACSGAVIRVAGLTGAVRGLNVLGPDGKPLRPDLVVIDDAQTRESSKSPTQTADREKIICDDILGLAGPTMEIAAFNLCTPVYPNDLAEKFLDTDRHPEWRGVRTRMLDKFPDRMDLWDRYSEIRRSSLRSGNEGRHATEFYRENRADMDAGAVVTWPERRKPGELSGLQSAMNLRIDNPRGFAAEYQCEPDQEAARVGAKEFDPKELAKRTSGYPRGQVPEWASRLTAFIDCGGELLWYAVSAWNESFGGVGIDYGAWPHQNRRVFAATDGRPTLKSPEYFPDMSDAQRLYHGVAQLVGYLNEVYPGIDVGLIDSGWEGKAVYDFLRAHPSLQGTWRPSIGRARTLTQAGVNEWKRRDGERAGHHWRMTAGLYGRTRLVQFDADAWKTILHGALHIPPGGPTGYRFYGEQAHEHELIAEHCAAEYSELTPHRGGSFDKWKMMPGRTDNHLWDCLVGSAVAASVAGLAWTATGQPEPAKETRPPLTFAGARGGQRPQSPAAGGGAKPLRYADRKAGAR